MDAAADYAAVRAALADATLPAYVSYVVRSHAGFDAINGDEMTTLVVRTRDGAVVSGKPPKMRIDSDSDTADAINPVRGPFKPECYRATSAMLTTFEAEPAEAIALKSICREKTAGAHSEDSDFSTVYADPTTHRPLAVVGGSEEKYVKASVDERFLVAGGHVLPASFAVKVEGSGPMFWLNVDARQAYSDYRFFARQP